MPSAGGANGSKMASTVPAASAGSLSRFNKTTGNIILDKEAKTGAVDIVIDTQSVDTGYGTFDEHIQGEDFLDTAKYPTATFKSTKVVFEGDKPVKVEGNLTLKGVTKPVTLTVTSSSSGGLRPNRRHRAMK